MAVDLAMTIDGQLILGPDGDLATVWGDDQIIQEVLFRLKTTRGDWVLSPDIGCSLEDFVGKPNISLTHTAIEQRIRTALTADFLLAMPEINVIDLPDTDGENTQVFILIEFASLENDERKLQVTAELDMRKGLVYARGNIRDAT
jgi:phage baseplate assembly protein W